VLARAGQLGRTLSAARVELVGPVVLACVAVALACERRWAAERRPLLARGHVQDAGYFLVFAFAIVPLVTLLGVASAHLLVQQAAWIQISSTAHWPSWLLVGVTLVAMDGCNWLTHWADHRFAPLWRVHAIHHSQEEMSVLTTFRTHPLVHAASFVAAALPVVALMGTRPLAPVLITVYLCLGALPHANVPWTYGRFGRILVSPAYHRIHHSVDGPYDVNLGIVLAIWDQCAGRAVFPTRATVACRTGLAGRPLPVEQVAERLRPLRLLTRQLLEPFMTVAHSPEPVDSHHRLAGTHVQGLAGDAGRFGREQEADGERDLIGTLQAAEGDFPLDVACKSFRTAQHHLEQPARIDEVGVHRPRADGIDGDPGRPELGRQALGEQDHARLGSAVGAE
jgi:sterol desaturase/sphingolipid hydroxylase (fatty acid hydroxylase superfamily)